MAEKKKEKRCKLTEAEKRERVAAALAKKKELESRAIQIVHREATNDSFMFILNGFSVSGMIRSVRIVLNRSVLRRYPKQLTVRSNFLLFPRVFRGVMDWIRIRPFNVVIILYRLKRLHFKIKKKLKLMDNVL
jgi:hypothetical protein